MELLQADRLQSSCWGSLTGKVLRLGKDGATSQLLQRVYNKMSALCKGSPSVAPCVLPVHSKDELVHSNSIGEGPLQPGGQHPSAVAATQE